MKKITFKKNMGKVLMCVLLFLSACSIPIISQYFGDQESDSEQEGFVSFPLADVETSFVVSPASDIVCNRFVATDGDDSNPGSEVQPWGSFQGAASMANPGDVVCFRDGTYTSEEIFLTKSGSEDALITFAAYPGERPILDGGGSTGELLIFTGGVSFVRVSGFTLRNFLIWGIEVSGGNRHIYLDHLEIDGGETSVRFTYAESAEDPPLEGPVEHVLLEDSLIQGSEYSAVDCTPGPCNYMTVRRVEILNTGLAGEAFYGSDGLEFARGHDVLVEDCYVHDNGGDGIDLGSRDRDGHMEGIVVRRNRVVRNHLNGIKVWAGGRIENNIISGSGDSAIWSGTYNCDIEIINNTVAYNLYDPSYAARNWAVVIGYPEELPKPEVRLTMVNNIFAFNADPMEGGPSGVYIGHGVQLVEEGHNIYFSNAGEEITVDIGDGMGFTREDITNGTWASYSGQGDGDLTLDPMFLSGWPDVDLHLNSNSPGIDAGASAFAPEIDLQSNPRDEKPDIGAYEEE